MQTAVRHGALTANTVATVALPIDADTVEVVNRGDADIFFTINGTVPTVDGNDVEIVTAGTALEIDRRAAGNVTVKLVSTGTPDYTVRGVAR
jgi:hypothetical protein